jgi:hypothetical protein
VAHICNPSYSGDEDGRILVPGQPGYKVSKTGYGGTTLEDEVGGLWYRLDGQKVEALSTKEKAKAKRARGVA